MEKQPHQEYRDELANELKDIRNKPDSENAKQNAKEYLEKKKISYEYLNAKYEKERRLNMSIDRKEIESIVEKTEINSEQSISAMNKLFGWRQFEHKNVQGTFAIDLLIMQSGRQLGILGGHNVTVQITFEDISNPKKLIVKSAKALILSENPKMVTGHRMPGEFGPEEEYYWGVGKETILGQGDIKCFTNTDQGERYVVIHCQRSNDRLYNANPCDIFVQRMDTTDEEWAEWAMTRMF
jgi:hypothetical protein